MHDVNDLLVIVKSVAEKAGLQLLEGANYEHKNYIHSNEQPKEIKALADTILEKDILQHLIPLGLPILSEEAGYLAGDDDSGYYFILDPLDGTFNFVKGLGPCAVSIALWNDRKPVFGVIYDFFEKQLIWGGGEFGAYCDGQKISVSDTLYKDKASICTGFPVRFNVESEASMKCFWNLVSPFAKVRMLGSAAMSLVNVAKGAAEVYSEKNIMLWDVAAGLAIVEGAGGTYNICETDDEWSYDVIATNGHIEKLP